jgi:O-succinylbenzoate synthase
MLDHSDPREAAEETRRFVELGFGCIKVKVSPVNLSNDDARLAAIRAAAGRQVQLRIDANASWSVEQAVEAISRLEAHGLEYVEQPVAQIQDLARVRRQVQTPIAADESVTSVVAVDTIAKAHAADLVVVKPALLGLRASVDIAKRAIAAGLDVVVTSTLDTSVGIAAALQLAATLPEPALPCGLATVDLLAGDLVYEPLVVRDGHMELPDSPGLGVLLDPASLKRWGRTL